MSSSASCGIAGRSSLVHRVNHTSWMFWKFANLRINVGGWLLPPNSMDR